MSAPITRSGIEELLEGASGRRRSVLPSGLKAIDRHLPGGGLALGALHEVAGGGHGAIDGAAAALFAAGIAARLRGRVLWCLTRQDLFAPALAQAGLMPDREKITWTKRSGRRRRSARTRVSSFPSA